MKKQLHLLRLFVAAVALAFFATAQATVIPYLPALQSFNGSSVNLLTFLPIEGDYTLEVQGTAGTAINVAGGMYTYTPETSALVRFAQKGGKVYVYEGNVYKTALIPVLTTQYPAIADADATSNASNLLINASFENLGALATGTGTSARYAFGTPWVTNVTINSTTNTIRIGPSTSAVNGTSVCVWRGSGNTNYFAQPISTTIQPNTSYKVIVRQIASGNAFANFNVGLGSTVSGMEYGYKPLTLGTGKEGTWSTTIRTPATVTGATYFTFQNTATSTSSSGTDPLTQIDYIALVQGIDVTGIVGASAATFLAGTAYAPENVAANYSAGDYYDMTPLIVNPTIEGSSNTVAPQGWTVDKGTGNTFSTTGQHYSGVTTNRYLDSWNGTAGSMLYTAQQTITGLPNGTYKLTAAARTSGAGSYLVAKTSGKTYRTEIINNGDGTVAATPGTLTKGFNTITVEAAVLDGTMTIGLSTNATFTGGTPWGGTWFSADDFTLSYLGEQKVLTVSETNFLFDDNNLSKTFTVSGAFLTGGVTLTTPVGITLSRNSITALEAQDGVQVTAQFAATATIRDTVITIASETLSKKIAVTALYGDASCFTPLYTGRTNLIADPYCNNRSKFGGWGDVAVSDVRSSCGARSLKVFGGSLDASLAGGTALTSNKTYRVRAKIYVPAGNTAKFGLFGIGNASDVDVYNSSTNDAWETADFTFKTATIGTGGIYFQRVSSTTDSVYVDNYELYEVAEPTVRIKYVDAANTTTSIKDDRVYTATWGTTLANYLTIAKVYTALSSDKASITYNAGTYDYDATSVDNATIAEGENVITLKFALNVPTGLKELSLSNAVYTIDNKIILDMNLSSSSKVNYTIYSVGGIVVAQGSEAFAAGHNTKSLNTSLQSGVYFVKVNVNGTTITRKVVL